MHRTAFLLSKCCIALSLCNFISTFAVNSPQRTQDFYVLLFSLSLASLKTFSDYFIKVCPECSRSIPPQCVYWRSGMHGMTGNMR